MLEIRQAKDNEPYKMYIQDAGISNEEAQVVESVSGGQITGFGLFSYCEDKVCIHHVDSRKDNYLYDGLIRAILFKATMLKIDRAEFFLADLNSLHELGFLEKESACINSIQSILSSCKKCK